ncbi:MAG: 6-bladed beta-propeller [Tannerellaceae bacterium]
MKRTCLVLLTLLLIACMKQGYEVWTASAPAACSSTGTLSDIAGEVAAIPLETNPQCRFRHASLVKRDGNHLFMVSSGQLFHFDCSGKFINRIIAGNEASDRQVTDYVIDPIRHQLIVLNDQMDVHYYNYNGTLLSSLSLEGAHGWNRMIKLAYYDRHIWATTENLTADNRDASKIYLEKWLYKFDTTFREVDAHKLTAVDLERLRIGGDFDPEPAVVNEKVYAHAPSIEPEELLRDTLYLMHSNKLEADNQTAILPLRINERFLISTYYNAYDAEQSYTYCFDRTENHAYNVVGGFEDNFYDTGQVPNLQAMDVSNNTFCYCKSGKEIHQAFPQRKADDNPVVFIVKLKS